MFVELDHPGIVVRDLDQAVDDYTALGFLLTERREVPHMGLNVAFFATANGQFIELVEPLDPTSDAGKHLAQHGEGLYVLGLRVDNLAACVERLQRVGVEVFDVALEREPPMRRRAFIRPSSTHGVMIELLDQRPMIEQWPKGKTDVLHTICNDSVAILVRDMDEAINDYQRLGFVLESRMGVPVRTFSSIEDYQRVGYALSGPGGSPVLGIKTAVFPLREAGGFLELVQPTDPTNLAAERLERHGEGMWVWKLRVKNAWSAAARWQEAGGRLLYQMAGGPPRGRNLALLVDTPASHGVTMEFFDPPASAHGE